MCKFLVLLLSDYSWYGARCCITCPMISLTKGSYERILTWTHFYELAVIRVTRVHRFEGIVVTLTTAA